MSAFGETEKKLNLLSTIEAIRPTLLPPVSNRMIFDDAFKVMAVGGPNQRKDFHIEMGAELFYQHTGPMTVVIINPHTGKSDPIRIEEGELFYLPAGIPHSPQRYADTVGIVFERERHESECDALCWYKSEDSNEILYSEYFHCKDLGTEIKAAILRFRAFLENPTPLPPIPAFADGLLACMEDAKKVELRKPFNLRATLDAAPAQAVTNIVEEEFVMTAVKGEGQSLTIEFPAFMKEIYFWQFAGSCSIRMEGDGKEGEREVTTLAAGEIHLLAQKNCPPGVTRVTVTTSNPEDIVLVNYNVTKF